MSEILLCSQSLHPKALHNQCGINIDQISTLGCTKPASVAANTPYLVGEDNHGVGRKILSQLAPAQVAQGLTDLSLSYGGDNVVALSEISAKLYEYNLGLIGASTTVYANRIGGFAGAVKEYQDALLEYRQAAKGNSAAKAVAKSRAHAAFQKMQFQFRHELNAVTVQVKSRRGTPLTNASRATNIASSSRNATKLYVANQVQANNLVKFTKYAKHLGNGLVLIDVASRYGEVQNSYQAGGNWERDLFIESSSFAASAITGISVAKAGGVALGFLMVATPVGWVGLVVGGVAVAGTAAVASIGMNSYAKNNSGEFYDWIMGKLGAK